MVLAIRQNLDVPKLRLVDADDGHSIVRNVVKSKVLLVSDRLNSPLAVILLLCDPLERVVIV